MRFHREVGGSSRGEGSKGSFTRGSRPKSSFLMMN